MTVDNWFPRSREVISQIFGDDADLFSRLLAATSPISTIETNVRQAIKAYRQLKWWGKVSRESFICVHYTSIHKFLTDPNTAARKVRSLYQNLIGNENVCPLDRWMKRYFGLPPEKWIGDKLYDELENKIRKEAEALGISPAQRQVQIWCASRGPTRGVTNYGDVLVKMVANKETLLRRLI